MEYSLKKKLIGFADVCGIYGTWCHHVKPLSSMWTRAAKEPCCSSRDLYPLHPLVPFGNHNRDGRTHEVWVQLGSNWNCSHGAALEQGCAKWKLWSGVKFMLFNCCSFSFDLIPSTALFPLPSVTLSQDTPNQAGEELEGWPGAVEFKMIGEWLNKNSKSEQATCCGLHPVWSSGTQIH